MSLKPKLVVMLNDKYGNCNSTLRYVDCISLFIDLLNQLESIKSGYTFINLSNIVQSLQ